MSTVDETLKDRDRRRAEVLRQIVRLRKQTADESEFGRLAAPVLDSMISEEAAVTVHRTGAWSDEERAILRAAYAAVDNNRAPEEAAKNLARTKAQTRPTAGHRGIKNQW